MRAAFEPVAEPLLSKQQARILRLLIDRIDYHGTDGAARQA